VATATVGYPLDVIDKVKKALAIKGPKYLQIYCPCVPGWGIEPKDTVKVSKLAVNSGFYPIVEFINGQLARKMTISKQEPVENFLKIQKRFKHLFASPGGQKEIARLQVIADYNIKKFGLIWFLFYFFRLESPRQLSGAVVFLSSTIFWQYLFFYV